MKVQLGQPVNPAPTGQPGQPAQKPSVVISPNPKRERIMIDMNGNQIDPRTKQIIKLAKDVV